MISKFQFSSIVFLLLTATACTIAQPTQDIALSATLPSTLLAATSVTPTSNINIRYPLLKTTMGDFVMVSARLVDEAHENKAPEEYKFLLIGLAQPDMQKLIAGKFSFDDFHSMTSNSDGEIHILGSDGSKTDYRGMGGWLDNNESITDDFVMGFLVPLAESYTLYWINNPPIPLNIEK